MGMAVHFTLGAVVGKVGNAMHVEVRTDIVVVELIIKTVQIVLVRIMQSLLSRQTDMSVSRSTI